MNSSLQQLTMRAYTGVVTAALKEFDPSPLSTTLMPQLGARRRPGGEHALVVAHDNRRSLLDTRNIVAF